MILASNSVILKAFQLMLDILHWVFNLLGVPNIFSLLSRIIGNSAFQNVVSVFRTWLSYIFYFFPKEILGGFLAITLVIFLARIALAIFRVITDLL